MPCAASSTATTASPWCFTPTIVSLCGSRTALLGLDELVHKPVIDDAAADRETVKRVVLCTGKVYYDLMAHRKATGAGGGGPGGAALPLRRGGGPGGDPRYLHAKEVVWCQEEPENMGARTHLEPLLRQIFRGPPLRWVGSRGEPGDGLEALHDQEQEALIRSARLPGLTAPPAGSRDGQGEMMLVDIVIPGSVSPSPRHGVRLAGAAGRVRRGGPGAGLLDTDKVSVDIPSPAGVVVKQLLVEGGQDVAWGRWSGASTPRPALRPTPTPAAPRRPRPTTPSEALPRPRPHSAVAPTEAASPSPATGPPPTSSPGGAPPGARARPDPRIEATGPHGRLLKEDVLRQAGDPWARRSRREGRRRGPGGRGSHGRGQAFGSQPEASRAPKPRPRPHPPPSPAPGARGVAGRR